jgi:hypothetical protein
VRNDADRTLVWPDGSIYRITRSSVDTRGGLLEMEWELPATAGPLNTTYIFA